MFTSYFTSLLLLLLFTTNYIMVPVIENLKKNGGGKKRMRQCSTEIKLRQFLKLEEASAHVFMALGKK